MRCDQKTWQALDAVHVLIRSDRISIPDSVLSERQCLERLPDIFGRYSARLRKPDQSRFVSRNELQDSGQKSGLACGNPDPIGVDSRKRQEPLQQFAIARDEGEGADRDGFGFLPVDCKGSHRDAASPSCFPGNQHPICAGEGRFAMRLPVRAIAHASLRFVNQIALCCVDGTNGTGDPVSGPGRPRRQGNRWVWPRR